MNHDVNPIVEKAGTLISRFIIKCRESSSSSSSSSVANISTQLCNILWRHGGTSSDDRLKKNNGRIEKILSQQGRWTCIICGKINIVIVGRECCSTCGRRRGYQGRVDLRLEEQQKIAEAKLLKYHHLRLDKVEQEFLAKSSSNLRLVAAKFPVSPLEKSKRNFYLHGKNDYKIDCRTELLCDIRDILESVRSPV